MQSQYIIVFLCRVLRQANTVRHLDAWVVNCEWRLRVHDQTKIIIVNLVGVGMIKSSTLFYSQIWPMNYMSFALNQSNIENKSRTFRLCFLLYIRTATFPMTMGLMCSRDWWNIIHDSSFVTISQISSLIMKIKVGVDTHGSLGLVQQNQINQSV